MSAAETVAAAQAAGVRLGLDGTDLVIESDLKIDPVLVKHFTHKIDEFISQVMIFIW